MEFNVIIVVYVKSSLWKSETTQIDTIESLIRCMLTDNGTSSCVHQQV